MALADYLANTIEPPRSDLGFEPSLCQPVDLHLAAGIEVKQVEELIPVIREAMDQASVFLDLG